MGGGRLAPARRRRRMNRVDLVLVGALLLLATRASADTWSSAPAQGGLGQASPAQGGAGCDPSKGAR